MHRHVWVTVAGRQVKVASGLKSQTVNICDDLGLDGQYERVVRLQDRFVEPHALARQGLASVDDLVLYLVREYGGREERRSGPSTTPAPVVRAAPTVQATVTVTPDTNSNRTRLEPVFSWLSRNGAAGWCQELLSLAEGLDAVPTLGDCREVIHGTEVEIPASPARLAWMLEHAEELIPQDGRRWRELRDRVSQHPARASALQQLARGERTGLPRELILEGPTHCDCFIECEDALIWVEGKRNDWLSPNTTWDTARDQLARNLEAAWLEASKRGKRYYCLLICHERGLKYHEGLLVNGYRRGTWTGGWPHLDIRQRAEFASRIGTVSWGKIATHWPDLRDLPELHDLNPAGD